MTRRRIVVRCLVLGYVVTLLLGLAWYSQQADPGPQGPSIVDVRP